MTTDPVFLGFLLFAAVGAGLRFALRKPLLVTGTDQQEMIQASSTHAQRHMLATVGGTVLAAIVLLVVNEPIESQLFRSDENGPYAVIGATLPLALAVVFLATFLVAERTWPKPEGEVRQARLARRSVSGITPKWLLVVTVVWLIGLTAWLTWTGSLSSGGSLSTAKTATGTVIVPQVSTEPPAELTMGPFPGAAYGIPTALLALAVMLLCLLTLRQIQRRPAVWGLDPTADTALRRRSASDVLGVTQAALGLTLANGLYVGLWVLFEMELAPASSLWGATGVATATVVILGVAVARR